MAKKTVGANGANGSNGSHGKQVGTYELKKGLAQMLKGGVIMDVINPEQAKIAEAAQRLQRHMPIIDAGQQRIDRADLNAGKRRPCCWPGCPHREKGSKILGNTDAGSR